MGDTAQILISLAAGAALTGVAQLALGLVDRRRRARVAARITFNDLYSALDRYTAALDDPPGWWELDLSLEGWHRYQEDLAAGLEIDSFHAIASIFYTINTHEAWRKAGKPFPPKSVEVAVPDIRAALNLIRLEAMSNREVSRLYRETPDRFWGYRDATGPDLTDD